MYIYKVELQAQDRRKFMNIQQNNANSLFSDWTNIQHQKTESNFVNFYEKMIFFVIK